MKCSGKNSLMVFSVLMLQASSGYADIGGVGSPVVPSNGPPQTQNNPIVVMQPAGGDTKPAAADDSKQATSSAPATAASGTAVPAAVEAKVIFSAEFTQHRLSYDNELKQAILAAEAENPRKREYTVTSTIPVLSKKEVGDNIGVAYQSNLADVVSKLGSYGVPGGKVHAINETSNDAKTQQISVSVK